MWISNHGLERQLSNCVVISVLVIRWFTLFWHLHVKGWSFSEWTSLFFTSLTTPLAHSSLYFFNFYITRFDQMLWILKVFDFRMKIKVFLLFKRDQSCNDIFKSELLVILLHFLFETSENRDVRSVWFRLKGNYLILDFI